MVEELIAYKCEICGARYPVREEAEECEGEGIPLFIPPRGMIFEYESRDDRVIMAVAETCASGHHVDTRNWACRDFGLGDNLGDGEYCDGWYECEDTAFKSLLAPAFKRMVNHLKEKEIPITIWNGKEAVPFEDYMKGKDLKEGDER